MKTSQRLESGDHSVLDSLLEGCQIIGPDWRYIYINDTAARHGRKTKEELLGKTMMEMYPGIEHTQMFALLRDCMENRISHQIENEFTYPNGKTGWFDLRIQPVPEGIFILSIDITARKEAEAELKKSRDFLDRMIDQSSYAMWISDAEGTLIRINRACCDLLKITEEEVVGRYNILNDNVIEAQGLLPLIKSVYEKGDTVSFEFTYDISQFKEFSLERKVFVLLFVRIFPIKDANGKITNAVVQCIDITERKKAELALRESLQNLQLVVKAANVGLFDWDLIANKVFYSPEWKRQIGYEEHEISDDVMEWQSRVHPDDLDRTLDIIQLYINKPWPDFRIEYRFRHKDGTYRWIMSQAALVYDEQGRPFRMLGSHVDITKRKWIEETIKNERDLARQYLDIAGVMFLVLNVDGTVLIVNRKSCEVLGRNEQDIIGKDWFDEYIPSGVRHKAKSMHKKAMAGSEPFKDFHESAILTANGEERTIAWHLTLIRGEQDEAVGLICFGVDITERRQMEKDLRDSERMLSSIVENTWGFVYRCRNEKDWPMDFVSQRIRDYTGYTPKEFITGHVHYGSLIHPDDSEPVWNEVQRAVEVQGSYDMEYRLLSRTGKQKWVWDRGAGVYDTNGNLVALEGIVVDITERKKVEQALRDSEERFNKAFHTSPDFIIITSVDEGKIVEVNRACTGISGYTRKELIGRSILELDLPAYPEDRERYINVMKKKGRVVDMDTGLRRKDGEICEVLMSGALIELSGKQHVLTIVKDITERKQAEQALLDSEDKFNKAFHASPDCMALLSLANGRITEANEACSRLTAYTREELITNSVLELGIFKDPEAWERYIVILQDDCRIVDMEAEVCRKDGDIRQVILSMDQIVLSGERYILVISKDITERKKIEDKLQTSEFRFRQMFENISSGVAVYEAINDGDGFIFRDFNSAAERIENKGRKEVIGRSVQEVFPAIKEFGLFEVFQRVWRTGKAEYFPVTFYRDSRTSGWRENYVYKLPSGEIVAVYDDITERKQTEEKLKESEARFYKAFNSNPDVVSITTLGNSVFIEVNDSFTRVFGYTRDEVIGRSSLELGLWADEKDRKAVVNEFREQGITENKEIAFRTKTGELRTMLVSTDIIGIGGEQYILAVMNDITARKRAELAVEESEAKLRQMFESVNDGIVVVDLNGVILEANEKAAMLYGLEDKDKLLKRSVFDFIAKNDRKKVNADFRKTMKRGFSNVIEYNILKADGSTFTGEVNAGVLEDTAGSPVSMIIVIRDVTERKQAEKKERELEALKELDTLRSQLLANVSHELRTPLTSIKGFVSTLLRPDVSWSDEEKLEFLNTIDQESDRLIDLITDLLDMSRIESGRLVLRRDNYNIAEILESVRGNINKLAEHHKLILDVPEGLRPVFVDLTYIGQVITNLVENAVKYSPDGSEIIVEASMADDFITVSVTDKGEGIPPGDEEKVFDRFYQAESIATGKKKGTGLGLSICRGIVETHGGRIWAENVPGKGARFSFHLPYNGGNEDNVDDTGN